MRSRLPKILAWMAGGLAGLLLILAVALLVLINSETALRWAWGAAQGYLPEGVAVARIQGRLTGPLVIEGLEIDNPTMRLRLQRARLDWRAVDLFSATLHVETLALRGLDFTAKPGAEEPPPEPAEPFTLPQAIDLPIDIVVETIDVENVSVRGAPDAEPFVVDNARLVADLGEQGWVIESLSASGPLFSVDGSAELTPRGRYAGAAKLDWRLTLPDLAPVAGQTRIAGDLDQLELTQQVAAPYNLSARATLSDVLDTLAVDAEMQLQQTRLAAIREDLPPVVLDAQARADGPLDALDFTLDTRASDPAQGTAVVDLDGRFTGEVVQIKQLLLTSPDTPGQMRLQGTAALAAGNRVDLALRWQDLQWPLAGAPAYSSSQGQFRLTGPLDGYRLDGGLQWRLADQEQTGRLRVNGSGDLQSFNLAELILSGAPGDISGQANIVWAPRLNMQAKLSGQNLNPGAIAPAWPGNFSLELAASAEQKADGLYARLQQLQAEGTLRDQPLSVAGQARHGPDGTFVQQLKLAHGANRLLASGQVTDKLDIDFRIDADNLGTSLPTAAGSLTGSGTAAGSLSQPRIQASLTGNGLRYQGNRLQSLRLEADIDASGRARSNLLLRAERGQVGTIELRSLALEGGGMPGDHQLALDADTSEGQASIALTGRLTEALDRWAFTLREAELAYAAFDPWQLDQPAAGQVSASRQAIDQACWTSSDARLCLQGSNDAKGTAGQVWIEDFAFAYLKPVLPPDLQIEGAISGQAKARLPAGGDPDVRLRLNTTQGAISTRDAQKELVRVLTLEPGEIRLDMAGGGLDAGLQLPLAEDGRIAFNARTPQTGKAPLAQRPLTGQLDIRIEDIDFLADLSPEVTQARGQIVGEYALSGSLSAPAIEGRLALQAPALSLATPGLELKDVNLSVIGRGREVGVQLSAKSGGGSLSAEGTLGLQEVGTTVDLQVSGEKFLIVNTPDARAYVSPDLQVAVAPERIDVEGTVKVPQADITPRNLPESGGVAISDDQVIIRPGREQAPGVAGRPLHARVRVVVGDPKLRLTESARRGRNYRDTVRRLPGDLVQFEGFGLNAVLAGNLLVVQEPGQPATGSGELRIVVGQYKAYGQDLTIPDGKILFAGGPVSEPALDVRAVRRPAEGILVGVRVRGRFDRPEFSLFSEPSSMTQSEQLSWLVLGRPLSGTSSSETSLMTKAAMTLGLKGGNVLAENVGSKIGVDELTVEGQETSTGGEQAALQVGKYLTPKLYVSYSVGLFEPVSTVRLRYSLTRRLSLETESSGRATGGDIIYSIEVGD